MHLLRQHPKHRSSLSRLSPHSLSLTPPETSQKEETPATTTAPSPFSLFNPSETVEKQDTPALTTVPVAPAQSTSVFLGGSFPTATSEASTAKLNPFADSLSSFASPKPSEPSQNSAFPNSSSLFPTTKPLFQPAAANDISSAATPTAAAEPATESSSPFSYASPAPLPSSSSSFKPPYYDNHSFEGNQPILVRRAKCVCARVV
ncbi:hypothetical protein N7448_000602 [Penicillium atrosanguineum]|nr:hypothetical protein N7526_005741 [Penicillium atrosanguineum]KAJ5149024.1 hypothetical protein N7448_000602 [Penicillium atrosanguineum]